MILPSVLDAPTHHELIDFDEFEHFEIVDGIRVELPPMSIVSSFVAAELIRLLGNYAAAQKLGRVVGEVLIHLPSVRGRFRRPDVVFVSYEKWAADRGVLPEDDAAWELAPDLAIEVVSPSDKAEELMTKVMEYLNAGVSIVWLIYPRQRYALVYESLSQVRGITSEEMLDGGAVLPGFTLPLTQLLPAIPSRI